MSRLKAWDQSRRRPLVAEMNVVPYVDVMLVLLVIFMVTTPLLTEGVEVALPKAQANVISSEEQTPIVLSVNAKGEYYLNIADNPKAPISKEDILHRVAAQLKNDPDRKVLVKGDEHVDYGAVIHAMVLLQAAGAESVGLLTENPN